MSAREMRPACVRVRDRIPARVDGTLPALEAARDEGHLEACGGCRDELEKHAKLLAAIREVSRVPAARLVGLEDEILRSLPARRRARLAHGPRVSWGWAAAAAVVLACAWKLTEATGLQPGSAHLIGLDPVLARLPGWTHVSNGLDHLSSWISRG